MRFLAGSLYTGRLVLLCGAIFALNALGCAQTGSAQTNSSNTLPEAPQASGAKSDSALLKQDYTAPKSHLFNLIAPYSSRYVPPPNFSNSPRIDQTVRDGRMYLSLSDAVALALENNLDLAIARYNLPIADTDILRSEGGGSLRGVNTGVVQGTPGGGVGTIGNNSTTTSGITSGASGGGTGGTSTAAGGAGTGSSGIVQSTLGGGPATPSFDPFLSGTLDLEQATQPQTSPFAGTSSLNQHTAVGNFTYNQGFATGTTLSVGYNNNRVTTNSLFNSVSPQLSSNFRATVSQPLLQGFGWSLNRRNIVIAKNDREITDVAFRQQVIATVVQIQNIYWNLVSAYENVKVNEESVTLANKTLSDNQKQVEIGTLAPIEVVRAQSQVAANQQQLIVAQTNLQLQELLMKNAISRNLVDPTLAAVPVVPTDTMIIPQTEPVVPIDELVNDALSHRPELAQSRINLKNQEITNRALKNGLLPSVNLFAFYGASAVGGEQSALATCPANPTPTEAEFCTPPGTFPSRGFGGTFSNLFDSSAPDKGIGINISIPIRNRTAQADQIRGQLEYQQNQMLLQQQQNQIRIDVRNSQYTLQQSRAQVEAARSAVALQRQSLDAEQKKYALGASTNTLVLGAERDLTQAESNLVAANATYEKARVDLDRATGTTLTTLSIDIADAENGTVNKMPIIPGVGPANQANGATTTEVPTQTPAQEPPQQQPAPPPQ
jgi:outer membrane protein TolC